MQLQILLITLDKSYNTISMTWHLIEMIITFKMQLTQIFHPTIIQPTCHGHL